MKSVQITLSFDMDRFCTVGTVTSDPRDYGIFRLVGGLVRGSDPKEMSTVIANVWRADYFYESQALAESLGNYLALNLENTMSPYEPGDLFYHISRSELLLLNRLLKEHEFYYATSKEGLTSMDVSPDPVMPNQICVKLSYKGVTLRDVIDAAKAATK